MSIDAGQSRPKDAADDAPRGPTPAWVGLASWAFLLLVAWLVGSHLNRVQAEDMLLQAPPLTGHFDLRLRTWILPAIVFGGVGVWFGPMLAQRLGWRGLLVVAAVAAGVWAFFLAMGDGPNHLTWPVRSEHHTLADLGKVGSPAEFLPGFVDALPSTAAHTRGHPPGYLMLLWVLDAIGLGGVSRIAALEIIGGALAVPAILVTLREVAGEARARLAAPFLVLAPTALWVATTSDALFAGLAAWAIALIVLATGRSGRAGWTFGLAGGVVFGLTLFSSYGLVLSGLIFIVVVWRRARWDVLVSVAIGGFVVTGAFLALGFWWFEGLAATRVEYLRGISRARPYAYFVFANLAAFAVTIGPAMVVALTRLRDREVWWLVGGALAAVLIADLSGMSKAEVERIWLPFAVWVLPAGIALARSPRVRWWLVMQAGFAVLVQVTFRGPG